MKNKTNPEYMRLSDQVLSTLDLALKQKDIAVSEILMSALEVSMTRNTGGKDFTERRDFSDDVKRAYERLAELKKTSS